MIPRLAFCLLLLTSPAFGAEFCLPDGSLKNENVMKYFALHYANPQTPLPDIKVQAENYDITYTKPACIPTAPDETRPLPWDQLHVVLTPK